MEIMEIRDISVTNTGPVGLIEEFKLLTLLGTSDMIRMLYVLGLLKGSLGLLMHIW